ncbi:MAG: glycoside hydrolase family 3 C-terminal domain-containing protein [Terrisporobacter othiniensis]|uniref:beta-glucosidase n=1 Tax=Terrisporobacter petrolearius TaxID=1460447 RepID=UPI0022E74D6A|nr:glycoside hydrolase family 3 C-terminal domain-containing protein [Terrisporobacter petrolearius]MDU4861751.1 glycoside hydrolase family 3 C-terminal domain-containing protein [Terrisporobacter othiniensis]MDU6995011.1 glycoside hydrolase family 3 C-terminal domain-containing protein [Terrisporobacter othiniensis]
MNLYEEASSIVKNLSLEEKCKFCCGIDFWHSYGIDKMNIPSIMLCDGPHGLRKEESERFMFMSPKVIKSTCFPTATALASTFDEELINRMGKALGEECRRKDVAVLLSPGINIKRLPICGRNFEYFSEDPYLSGKMSAALIRGIQSKGVAACLKHFAANSQEKYRMTINSIIDERALREIYLKGFEIAIKGANPWCVMMAYNRLNGQYCCENKYLMQDILRNEWNYDGCIISDWGGVNDIISSINNGLNLEMPGYKDDYYKILQKAVETNKLDEKILNQSVTKVIELILRYKEGKKIPYKCNFKDHIDLAEKIAESSAVLLKNDDNILPGNNSQKVGIIGRLAKEPVYQGLGSSHVNANTIDNAYDVFVHNNCNINYADGYSLENDEIDELLLKKAIEVAKNKDIVYLFIGLPKYYEAEGYDRKNLKLPKSHDNLVYEISRVNKNLVVILQGGSVVEMPWSHIPKGILLTHLSGCRGGNATVNLLLGNQNPSGKLSETYANTFEDYPSVQFYPGDNNYVEYRESIFIGYRYFDSADINVKYPFGFGLSYTTFEYSNMKIKYNNYNNMEISVTVTNVGDLEGKEVAQLYVSCLYSKLFRAKQELKGFKKINLKPKESKEVTFILDEGCFTYYNIQSHQYEVEEGQYGISIGSSSRDIKFSTVVNKRGNTVKTIDYKAKYQSYYELYKKKLSTTELEFENIYNKELPIINKQIYPFTINSTINDIKSIYGGDLIISAINKKANKFVSGDKAMEITVKESLNDQPFRLIAMVTRGAINRKSIQGFVDLLNKHYIKGFLQILRNRK